MSLSACSCLCLALLGLAVPPVSRAALEIEWSAGAPGLVTVGQLDADPALEIVASNPQGALAVLDATDGKVEYSLPTVWTPVFSVSALVRDTDGDGIGELITSMGAPYRMVAVYDFGSGAAQEQWIITNWLGSNLRTVDLDAAAGIQVAYEDNGDLVLLDATTGATVFDSGTDPRMPEPGTYLTDQVADLDADGVDEMIVLFDAVSVTQAFVVLLNEGLPSAAPEAAGTTTIGARLFPSAPNPASGPTTISFELTQPSRVTLRVFNAAGRRVDDLLQQDLPAGRHQVQWNGLDVHGRRVASGVYFYELDVGGQRLQKRLIQIR